MPETAKERTQSLNKGLHAGILPDELSAALQRYSRRYSEENGTVRRMQDLLNTGDAAFSRNFFTPGHFTGSAWVIDPLEEKVLLTHHRRLDMWLQLGGHGEGELDILGIALREAVEESGIPHSHLKLGFDDLFDIDVHAIPPGRNEPAHSHFDIRFLFTSDSRREVVVSDESHDLSWVELDALESYTQEESMLRMRDKSRLLLDALKRDP